MLEKREQTSMQNEEKGCRKMSGDIFSDTPFFVSSEFECIQQPSGFPHKMCRNYLELSEGANDNENHSASIIRISLLLVMNFVISSGASGLCAIIARSYSCSQNIGMRSLSLWDATY